MKFFEEISKNNDYSFSKIAGPHGYTHILFGNCIVPGIIESESNEMKIAKRNRYYLGQKSLENIEKMPTYNGEFDNHYKFYAAAFSLYEENSRLLHDIINSITFFLDIKIKDSLCLSPEISNGMRTLNDLILEIKNIKSQYLSKFSYSENYEEILNKLDGSISNFKESVKYYYQETDQFNNETSLSKEEDDLVSGYSLFNTLIDYHTGLSKGPRNIRSNLKPHKMLRKFQRMFVNHAEKKKKLKSCLPKTHTTHQM